MDNVRCKHCKEKYNNKKYVPRLLDCFHTLCSVCVDLFNKDDGNCPACTSKISKPSKHYPTNDKLLAIAKDVDEGDLPKCEKLSSLMALIANRNKLNTRNYVLEKTINQRKVLKQSMHYLLKSMKERAHSGKVIKEEVESLGNSAEQLLEAVDNLLLYEIPPDKNKFLVSGKKDCNKFMVDLLYIMGKGQVFACELSVGKGYLYGEIKYEKGLFYVHSLTSGLGREFGEQLVWLDDLRKYVPSVTRIKPFIRVGEQNLLFTLKDDVSYAAYRLIRFCTGEADRALKKCDVQILEFHPDNGLLPNTHYSSCVIEVPDAKYDADYDQIFRVRKEKIVKGTVVIQCVPEGVHITKIPDGCDSIVLPNVIGVLSKGYTCDIEEMRGCVVDECGVVFDF